LVVVALLLCGCSTLTELSVGPAAGVSKGEDPTFGVAADGRIGLGFSPGSATDTFGVEGVLRGKAATRSQSLGFGEGVYVASSFGKGVGLARGGLHLVFERFDERLLVGGGPYASLSGGYIVQQRDYFSPGIVLDETRRERTLLTFGPAIELDARFSRPSVLTFIGFNIGLAWTDESVGSGVHLPQRRVDPASVPDPLQLDEPPPAPSRPPL
jgi:hypothetical protein